MTRQCQFIMLQKKKKTPAVEYIILLKKKKCFIRLNKIFNLSETFKNSKGN